MIPIKDFVDANKILQSYTPNGQIKRDYNLDNMITLMDYLGNPQDKLRIIHVAGTSGKTSTAYFIAAILIAKGLKTGLSISPHIDKINERTQINLKPIAEPDYCRALGEFINIIEKSDVKPSYFELLTAFAFWIFNKERVDFAVMEVGLGGLLDSTNVTNRQDKVCVITDIGIDHISMLGDNLKDISEQKAGIIKPGNHVFINLQPSVVTDVIRKKCQKTKATLHITNSANSPLTLINDLALPDFQKRNLKLAHLATSYALKRDDLGILSPTQIRHASRVYIPGRMEAIKYKGKQLILDGSHNEQKVTALVQATQKKYGDAKVALLLSFGKNKYPSIKSSLRQFRKLSDEVILTTFNINQNEIRAAIDPIELAEICKQVGFGKISTEPDTVKAINKLLESKAEVGIISGSNFLINRVRPLVMHA